MGFPLFVIRARSNKKGHGKVALLSVLERVMGIEPTFLAWEATFLPLEDTRDALNSNSSQRADANGFGGVSCSRECPRHDPSLAC